MPFIAKLLVLSLVLTAASASAKEPAAKKTTAQDQVKYCVQIEPFSGSRISTVECRTKAEWAAQGVDIEELLRK